MTVTDAVWRKLNWTEEQIAWGVNSQAGLPDGGSCYCISELAYEGLHAIIINSPLVCWLVHQYGWLAGGGHFPISSWWGNGFGRNGVENRWGRTALLPSQRNIIISIFASGKYSWARAGALRETSESFPARLQQAVSWSDKWSHATFYSLYVDHGCTRASRDTCQRCTRTPPYTCTTGTWHRGTGTHRNLAWMQLLCAEHVCFHKDELLQDVSTYSWPCRSHWNQYTPFQSWEVWMAPGWEFSSKHIIAFVTHNTEETMTRRCDVFILLIFVVKTPCLRRCSGVHRLWRF